MTAEFFEVEIDGQSVKRLEVALDEIERFCDDLRPLGPVVYDEWFSPMEAEQFQSEGGHGGTPWEVSEEYAKRKADKYGNLPIEQLPDHALLSSLTDRNAAGAVYDVSETEMVFGSRLPYAHRQHTQNPLIAPTSEDYAKLESLLRREMIARMHADGLEVA